MKELICLREGTCTDRAGKYLIKNNSAFVDYSIKYFDSFEEGIIFFKNFSNLEDRILIPDIANEYRKVVMDDSFERDLENIFWYENPPLYLAKNKDTIHIKSCSSLPVLRNLINKELNFVDARNTQESAELCRDKKTDACITNQQGVEKNNLEILEELKKIKVMWVPFKKSI